MKLVWVGSALAGALAVQTALTALWPDVSWMFDPFIVVLVYFGLRSGEINAMLIGAAAGWIQDIQFGGAITGFAALSKLIVGFGVGQAGDRFMLVALGPRMIVLFTAALLDSLLLEQLAALFEVALRELTFPALVTRASLTAIVGVLLFEALGRRRVRRSG